MDNTALLLLLAAVLLVAVIGVVVLVFSAKNGPKLQVAKYQTKWLAIENSIDRETPATHQLAILQADKLLDQALRERRFKGTTMGERMKSANSVWKNANHVWNAHKIRNQLAHEPDAHVTYDITLRALSAYKQALKDMGAI
ncbi:hypothetical protein IPM09_01535 [Candidatus Saccharibacteria bacterium]|nr:MAG: hypothetical protein IPM09_01535 [Candidatus Saccharibacteria bacterium]